jgi:nitrite reductase/ring-hydroxylating ferredoxin subunit
MMAFRRVVALEEVWDGEMRGFVVDSRKVLIIKLDGEVYAYEDRCAHLGVALSEGLLESGVLICSAHHYQYDARTGQGVNPKSVRLRTYPVAIKDGAILVDIEGRPA